MSRANKTLLRLTLVNVSYSGQVKNAGQTKPLYRLCEDRLTSTSNCGLQKENTKRLKDRLKHAKEIINCYNNIAKKI